MRKETRHGSTVLVFVLGRAQQRAKVLLSQVLAFHVLCLVLAEHCSQRNPLCLLSHSHLSSKH